jgi:hypothetical protein
MDVVKEMEMREAEHQDVIYKVVDLPLEDWSDAMQRTQHTRDTARLILKLIGRDPAEVDAIDLNA